MKVVAVILLLIGTAMACALMVDIEQGLPSKRWAPCLAIVAMLLGSGICLAVLS